MSGEQSSDPGIHRLKEEYRKEGYVFKLIKRTELTAMFVQMNKDKIIAYEVGKIKKDNGGKVGDRVIEPGERFWSNEDIGRIAKSITNKNEALRLFDEMELKHQKQQYDREHSDTRRTRNRKVDIPEEHTSKGNNGTEAEH